MSGRACHADKSRDQRRIQWTARILQTRGDGVGAWEDCRGGGAEAQLVPLEKPLKTYAELGGEIVRHPLAAGLTFYRLHARGGAL
jgi:hypothetical protein